MSPRPPARRHRALTGEPAVLGLTSQGAGSQWPLATATSAPSHHKLLTRQARRVSQGPVSEWGVAADPIGTG
jgi:hypothetical protein